MVLKDTFPTVAPRETAGPRSYDRFEYQRDWSLCRLLELHAGAADYLIAFDLHDDVLVFDSESDPSLIAFFQVKTKSPRHWTRSDLLRRRQGSDGPLLSLLGKLYSNKLSFPAHTQSLTFVSNVPISVTLADGTDSTTLRRFTSTQLAADERDKIARQLALECGACAESDLDAYLGFEVSDLSLTDHEAHAQGKLVEFLDARHPERKFSIRLIYRALSTEVSRRMRCQERPQSFAEIGQKKGLGRAGFEVLLQDMGVAGDDPAETWRQVEHRLSIEHMPILRVRALQRRWRYVEAQRLDPTNVHLARLARRVDETLKSVGAQGMSMTLSGLIEHVLEQIRTAHDPGAAMEDDDIRALILMRTYEPTAGEISPPNSSAADDCA